MRDADIKEASFGPQRNHQSPARTRLRSPGPQFASGTAVPSTGTEIAARIRGLVAGQAASLPELAALLRVDELALRISLDELAPYPTIEVIAAVVSRYGVDPCWLLTGEYNAEIHRAMLESRTDELPRAIGALVASTNAAQGILHFRMPSRSGEA
jgi:hypothetical protein